MEETTVKVIKDRITELQAEMDKFVREANTQVVAYQAGIGELKRLIGETTPKES